MVKGEKVYFYLIGKWEYVDIVKVVEVKKLVEQYLENKVCLIDVQGGWFFGFRIVMFGDKDYNCGSLMKW